MPTPDTQGVIAQTIEQKLNDCFLPTHLEVLNESHRHHVPANSETHFKVVIVSDHFVDLRPLSRHRLVNTALAHELATGVHALSIHTFTPSEWEADVRVPRTPNCRSAQ